MLSPNTEERLARLIMTISEEEKATEVVRQMLGKQPAFEPYAAFQRLDSRCEGYLTSTDLVNFLRHLPWFHAT